MGTPQILFVALVILILGVSIVAGLQYVTRVHKTNIKQSSILDMKAIAQMVIEWWKTSENTGGGSYKNPITSIDLPAIDSFISYNKNSSGAYITGNGEFEVKVTGEQEVTIVATTQYADVSPQLIISLPENEHELQ
jgi:chaperone required for assembly of F1-ATPase